MDRHERRNLRYQRPGTPPVNPKEEVDVTALAAPKGLQVEENTIFSFEQLMLKAYELSEMKDSGEWNDLPENTKKFFIDKAAEILKEEDEQIKGADPKTAKTPKTAPKTPKKAAKTAKKKSTKATK